MKINMAEGDYFNIGMIVCCTTCHGQKIQGEVVAFDHGSKMLALKSPTGKANSYDMRLLNLGLVTNVTVIQEALEAPPQLANISVPKIDSRVKQNVKDKMRKVNYIGVGVTPLAQNLFHAITKTITEVLWDKQNIVVMDQVTIVPPYYVENCKGKEGSKALQHVKKIVDKYHRDEAQRDSSSAERDQDRESSTSSSS